MMNDDVNVIKKMMKIIKQKEEIEINENTFSKAYLNHEF